MGATAEVVDFTNVKEGGNFNKKHQPEGDYRAQVIKVEDTTKKDDKSVKMWLFTIKVGSGTYPYYCNRNAANQAWKIRNLFIAAGINVPKKRVKVDPNLVVGKTIGVTLEDEEYDGKMQSSISATFPPSELEGSGEEDEEDETEDETEEVDEPTPPKKKAKEGKKGKKAKEAPREKSVEAPQGKKKKGKKAKTVDEVSDDELEELEIEEL